MNRRERVAAAQEAAPLSVRDVAVLFGVNPRTVKRWAVTGKVPSFRTLGGQIRFHRSDIDALLEGSTEERS